MISIVTKTLPALAAQTSIGALLLWLIWYTWRFIITPKMYPYRPKELPYLVPYFGHFRSLFTSSSSLFTKGKYVIQQSDENNSRNRLIRTRLQFGGDIWICTLLGKPVYVVASAKDVQTVYKMPKVLSRDEFIKGVFEEGGVDQDIQDRLFDLSSTGEGSWATRTVQYWMSQLNPGEKLEAIQKELFTLIDDALSWERLSEHMIGENEKGTKSVLLYALTGDVLIHEQVKLFFDKSIYEIRPGLVRMFQRYEEEVWRLGMGIPNFLANNFLSLHHDLKQAMVNYVEQPPEKRSRQSWIIHKIDDGMRNMDVSSYQRGCVLFTFFHVMNANTYKLAFWTLAYTLSHDSSLLDDLRAESTPAFKDGKDKSPDFTYLTTSCPLLASICEEALRLTNDAVGIRYIKEEATIRGKRLEAGRRLMMPFRPMHLDNAIFGNDSASFNPRRFLDDKNLINNKAYRPFGGALDYCPGRFIARREVYVFVAILLIRFEVSVAERYKEGKPQRFPTINDSVGHRRPAISSQGGRPAD